MSDFVANLNMLFYCEFCKQFLRFKDFPIQIVLDAQNSPEAVSILMQLKKNWDINKIILKMFKIIT